MSFDHFGIIIFIWVWLLHGTENVLWILITLVSLYFFDCDYFVERKTFDDFWDSMNFTALIFAVDFQQLPKVVYRPKKHSVQVKIPSQHNLQQLAKTHCESQCSDIRVFRFLITLVSLYFFDCDYFVKQKTFYDFWSPWYHYIFLSVITSWNWKRSMIFDHLAIIIFFWLRLFRGTENVLWILIILVSLYSFDYDYLVDWKTFYNFWSLWHQYITLALIIHKTENVLLFWSLWHHFITLIVMID